MNDLELSKTNNTISQAVSQHADFYVGSQLLSYPDVNTTHALRSAMLFHTGIDFMAKGF